MPTSQLASFITVFQTVVDVWSIEAKQVRCTVLYNPRGSDKLHVFRQIASANITGPVISISTLKYDVNASLVGWFLVLDVGYDSNWQWRCLMKIIHHIAVEHAGNASLFKPGCCCMNEYIWLPYCLSVYTTVIAITHKCVNIMMLIFAYFYHYCSIKVNTY